MSSYFDDASLVMIPSGYKTSKVYSVKPTDGSGDLTFSRSNDTATRVNSAGLIEKVRTNLVPNGLSFDASTGVLCTTVTSDSPISGVSSTRITKNEAAGTLRYGIQNASASALTGSISYTISRYFKYDGYNATTSLEYNDSFQWGGISWVQNINIASTGVTLQAPSNCTSKITNVGNGWYRVDVTIVNGASPSGSPVSYLLKVDSTLSTGQGFLTAAPQLETGDIATDYIATTSAAVSVGPVANVPRLDYLNSSCPRLLLEPQRTNLVTYSDGLQVAQAFGATLTKNQITSPDGYVNASLLTPSGGAAGITLMTGSFSGNYTVSVYLKGTVAGQKVRVFGDLQSTIANFTLTTSWARYTTTFNSTNATGQSIYLLAGSYFSPSENNPFYIYGAQIEAGTYATSYIPTLGAAVTRGADAASKTSASALIGQTEGTLFCEVSFKTNDAGTYLSIEDWANLELVRLYSDAGPLNAQIYNSANVFIAQTSYNAVVGQSYKMALAYSASGAAFYVNGVLVGQTTSAVSVPTCSNVRLAAFTSGQEMNADIKQALLFKTRLSNADLAALTA